MRQHLRALTAQAQKQDAQNRRLHQQNLALRREITALRYDRRAIEQAARDQLFLTQPDEIVILCPK
jgi:cell division protein FtsB